MGASAVGESTTFAYVIYAYGFNIVDIGIGLCAAYFLGALNSTLVPKFFGLRRSVYLGLWSYVAVCLIFGFLAGPEHKTFILIIMFFILPKLCFNPSKDADSTKCDIGCEGGIISIA